MPSGHIVWATQEANLKLGIWSGVLASLAMGVCLLPSSSSSTPSHGPFPVVECVLVVRLHTDERKAGPFGTIVGVVDVNNKVMGGFRNK